MIDNFYEKLNEYGLTTKFLVKVSPNNAEEPPDSYLHS